MRLLLLLCTLLPSILAAQVPIGSWTDHLSYSNANSLAVSGSHVYCGTSSGAYLYNIEDNSITRYSTINLLSDVAIQKIAVNPNNNILCAFYVDGNIDLIENGKKTNLAFLKNSHAILDKKINHISFHDEYAFISYDFGLIKLNTAKKEISETYTLNQLSQGTQVNASAVYNEHIYIATTTGVYKGFMQDNLLNQNNWTQESSLQLMEYNNLIQLNDTLFVVSEDEDLLKKDSNNWVPTQPDISNSLFISSSTEELQIVYKDSIVIFNDQLQRINSIRGNFSNFRGIEKLSQGHYFIADKDAGLWEYKNFTYHQTIKPNGPPDNKIYAMDAIDGKLWAVKGGMTNYFSNQFEYGDLRYFDGTKWKYDNPWTSPIYLNAFDLVDVAVDPNNEEKVYMASWGGGLVELQNNIPVVRYDQHNSSLVPRSESADYVGVGGIDFDEEGNLWVTNSFNPIALSVKKTDNTWKNFDLSQAVEYTTTIADVVVSNAGLKWILLPRSNEIIVFDDNGSIDNTTDDRLLKLTTNPASGNLPGSIGITVAFDKNGDAWAGNNQGVFVFYNADNIFSNYKTGAQRIIIDGGENYEVLLGTVSVTDIKIDGANRKWIATDGSGVYLISPDGKNQIHHFTTKSSPLFSNVVNKIAIDHKTGSVFMSTDKGLIEYRSDATEGQKNFSEVKVFPNPVRPDYHGPIHITGLMANSTLKITDISGHLVNEITSLGGQASWDGKDFNGKRAATGVYLIFASGWSENNSLQTEVAKILFVR